MVTSAKLPSGIDEQWTRFQQQQAAALQQQVAPYFETMSKRMAEMAREYTERMQPQMAAMIQLAERTQLHLPRQPTAAEDVAMWSAEVREAIARRDQAIRAMREEGATLRAIAETAGLTHPGVKRILDRS